MTEKRGGRQIFNGNLSVLRARSSRLCEREHSLRSVSRPPKRRPRHSSGATDDAEGVASSGAVSGHTQRFEHRPGVHGSLAAGLLGVGHLTATVLGLPVEVYDPSVHYEAVRNQWFGTSIDETYGKPPTAD